ncbi:MAG: hypothetical protein ACFCVC_05285 [Acidimicrobiia bacterium]
MKHRFVLIPAFAIALAACGGGDTVTEPTEPPATTTPTAPPTTVAPGGGQAIGTIDITITHPDADPVGYTIGCTGDAFPVTPEVQGVDGAAACDRLADPVVLDRLVNGVPADQVCTEIYGGPDVAVITGSINNEEIDATVDRANGCGIDDWDTLLAGVLPPALGFQG